MFVLIPYFQHRVYTVLDVIGSQRWLECTGYMQTLYALYKGLECSWILVATGVSWNQSPKGWIFENDANHTSTHA